MEKTYRISVPRIGVSTGLFASAWIMGWSWGSAGHLWQVPAHVANHAQVSFLMWLMIAVLPILLTAYRFWRVDVSPHVLRVYGRWRQSFSLPWSEIVRAQYRPNSMQLWILYGPEGSNIYIPLRRLRRHDEQELSSKILNELMHRDIPVVLG